MGQEGTVAPKERVNIVYKPATGVQEEKASTEDGDAGRLHDAPDDTPLEERKPINIDKDNFNDVMKAMNLKVSFGAKNVLVKEEGAEVPVTLQFKHVNDFGPEAVVQQVPELNKLLQLRNALLALKGPLGNVPGFRKKIMDIMADDAARDKLLKELGVG